MSREDEEAVVQAEDFEESYNFRFQEPGSNVIVGHSRKVWKFQIMNVWESNKSRYNIHGFCSVE